MILSRYRGVSGVDKVEEVLDGGLGPDKSVAGDLLSMPT